MPVEVAGSSWGSVCVLAGHVRGATAAVGVALAPAVVVAGRGRLPTSVSLQASSNDCECCERQK